MGLRADSTSPARFLYNNYQQALKIIAENQHLLDKYKAEYGLTDETIESWLGDELAYLQKLKDEPPEDILKVTYYEALETKKAAQ